MLACFQCQIRTSRNTSSVDAFYSILSPSGFRLKGREKEAGERRGKRERERELCSPVGSARL